MKKTILAISSSIALCASPVLADDSVKLSTTKSTQEQLGGNGILIGIGVAAIVGGIIIASDNDDSVGGT